MVKGQCLLKDISHITPLDIFGDVWRCCGFNGEKFSTAIGREKNRYNFAEEEESETTICRK